MSDSKVTSDRATELLALLAFVLVTALAAVDLVTDLQEGATWSHVAIEAVLLIIGAIGAGVLAVRLARMTAVAKVASAEARALAGELADRTAEAERWQREARTLMEGLSRAIDEQFERWALSPAEKEVALLLLKGLTHREIAGLRSVTEATARQQARAVYKKAGLAGRHDLSAFFLEDLMVSDGRGP